MSTRALQINTEILNNSDIKKRVLNILIFSGAALALCYVFLLSNMVWNIIARKNIENEVRSLSTDVNSLELQYLSLSNKVDLNLAYSLGFKEIGKSYATRKDLGSLALAPHEL